jgi:hypothetical protein
VRFLGAALVAALAGGPAAAHDLFVGPADSIQAAVAAAAPGDTIRIAGAHREQVIVTGKPLTLAGVGGATILPPAGPLATRSYNVGADDGDPPQYDSASGLIIVEGCDATISNLTIDGAGTLDASPDLNGIAFIRAGGVVSGCAVRGICGSAFPALILEPDGIDGGNAVFAANDQDDVRRLTVSGCVFTRWNSGAVVAFGIGDDLDAITVRVRVVVEDSVAIGAGPSTDLPQFALAIYRGAVGDIRRNYFSDVAYTREDYADFEPSRAIHGNYGDHYVIEDNVFERVASAITLFNVPGARIAGNRITSLPGGLAGGFPTGVAAGNYDDRVVGGVGPEVVGNVISYDTGVWAGPGGPDTGTAGIYVFGGNASVLGNDVRMTFAGAPGDLAEFPSGIAAFDAGNEVRGNFVSCDFSAPDPWSPELVYAQGDGLDFAGNVLRGPGPGGLDTYGLTLAGADVRVEYNVFLSLPVGIQLLGAPGATIRRNVFVRVGTTVEDEGP